MQHKVLLWQGHWIVQQHYNRRLKYESQHSPNSFTHATESLAWACIQHPIKLMRPYIWEDVGAAGTELSSLGGSYGEATAILAAQQQQRPHLCSHIRGG